MARLMTFVGIALAMMFLFTFFGFNSTGTFFLDSLGLIDNPQSFEDTPMYTKIVYVIALLGGVSGLIIGFFGRGESSTAVNAILAAFLLVFVNDVVSMIVYTRGICDFESSCGWVSYIVTTILGIIVVMLALSIYDWATGND